MLKFVKKPAENRGLARIVDRKTSASVKGRKPTESLLGKSAGVTMIGQKPRTSLSRQELVDREREEKSWFITISFFCLNCNYQFRELIPF